MIDEVEYSSEFWSISVFVVERSRRLRFRLENLVRNDLII